MISFELVVQNNMHVPFEVSVFLASHKNKDAMGF